MTETSAIDLVERADKLVAQWEEARSEFFGPDVRAIVCDFAEWHLEAQSDTITRLQAALTEFVQARDAWLTTTCGSHSEHMAANRLDAAHENARKAVGGE